MTFFVFFQCNTSTNFVKLKTIVLTKSRNLWSRKLLEFGYNLCIVPNCIQVTGYTLPNVKETIDVETDKQKN